MVATRKRGGSTARGRSRTEIYTDTEEDEALSPRRGRSTSGRGGKAPTTPSKPAPKIPAKGKKPGPLSKTTQQQKKALELSDSEEDVPSPVKKTVGTPRKSVGQSESKSKSASPPKKPASKESPKKKPDASSSSSSSGSEAETTVVAAKHGSKKGSPVKKKGSVKESSDSDSEPDTPKKQIAAKDKATTEKKRSVKESSDDSDSEHDTPKKQIAAKDKVTAKKKGSIKESSDSDSEPDTPKKHAPKDKSSTTEKNASAQPKNDTASRESPFQPKTVSRKVSSDSDSESDSDKSDAEAEPAVSKSISKLKSRQQEKNAASVLREAAKEKKGAEDKEILEAGRRVFRSMTATELQELLDKIDTSLSALDTVSCDRRFKSFDWSAVTVGNRTAEECRTVWMFLKHNARSFRIMKEYTQEIRTRLTTDNSFMTKLIESIPGFPQKPISSSSGFAAFNMAEWQKIKDTPQKPNYVSFQKECRAKFDALPEQVKKEYDDKATKVWAEYEDKLRAFYTENPDVGQYQSLFKSLRPQDSSYGKRRARKVSGSETANAQPRPRKVKVKVEMNECFPDAPQLPHYPVAIFMNSKLKHMDPKPVGDELATVKNDVFSKWKALSDRKKAKWINKCIQEIMQYFQAAEEYKRTHPNYCIPDFKLGSVLNQPDIVLWENHHGKPVPPGTQQEFYIQEYLKSDENAHLSEEERAAAAREKWPTLDWYNKEMINMKYKMVQMNYRKELLDFYTSLPDFLKPECKKRIHKKYLKVLEDVEKFPVKPELNETETHHDNSLLNTFDNDDGELQHVSEEPQSKKAKKRKKDKSESDFHDSGEHPLQADQEEPSSKKKKKKKKRHEEDSAQESDGIHAGDANWPQSTKSYTKDYASVLTDHSDRVAFHITSEEIDRHNPNSKHIPKKKAITKSDVFEAIRGIFDSRALAHGFSVFYYFARHVASEKYWMDILFSPESTLEDVAMQMIKFYFNLPSSQQEMFITQSYRFHVAKRHSKGFPTEPIPPPRYAVKLYTADARRQKIAHPVPFTQLPESEQTYYVKKLYHETKLYMRRFEAFVTSMTPSDFVEYAVHRYHKWADNMYTKQSSDLAFYQNAFPMSPITDVVDDYAEQLTPMPVERGGASDNCNNPFAQADRLIELHMKKRHTEALLN